MAPRKRKAKVIGRSTSMTTGVVMLTLYWCVAVAGLGGLWAARRDTKPPKSARDTRAAEPIAKPLPIAAVVLPAASRAVSLVAHELGELGHLGETTSIVGDGAVHINGETGRECSQHAKGSEGNAVHPTEGEGNENVDGEEGDRQNAREVAKGETVNDVGGGTRLAGFSDLLHRGVGVGGVVLGDETDEATTPEATDDTDPGTSPAAVGKGRFGGCVDLVEVLECEAVGKENVRGRQCADGHEEC